MFYYLYEIRNSLNGKIYVGVHKTKSMDDGYMGSGNIIRSAILKHGISNFSKVILETFENAENMYAREKEIVNDEFLLREDVYNLRRGGQGGWDYINSNNLNDRTGMKHTDLSRSKMGHIPSSEEKQLSSERMKNNNYNPKFSLTGDFHPASGTKTIEHIEKIRQGVLAAASLGKSGKLNKDKPKPKIECPHCHKIGGINVMKRWHFDNCGYSSEAERFVANE